MDYQDKYKDLARKYIELVEKYTNVVNKYSELADKYVQESNKRGGLEEFIKCQKNDKGTVSQQ